MPTSHRRGRRGTLSRAIFSPTHEEGVWVTVAGILVISVVMMSMASWIARELSTVRSEEEFKRTEDLLERLKKLQGDLQVIELGDVINFQAPISAGTPSMYAPKLAGTLSTVDASQSAIRVIAHTTRWDFEELMWRSENGLSENIYIGSDPNRDDYGYIALDNNWLGNRFITKTHRTIVPIMSYDSVFSARFVAPGTAPGTVTVNSAKLFIYNSGNPDPNNPYKASIYIARDDNHGKPNVTPASTTRDNVGNVFTSSSISDSYPVPKGTWGWMTATGLNATLNSGQVYHLVLDLASNGFGIEPNDWDYLAIAYTEPRNTVWVDNGTGNENRSVVLWTRGTIDLNPHWDEFYDAEPVFVLDLGGDNWGNPYHGGFKYYDEDNYYSDIEGYGDRKIYISYSDMDSCYSAGVINSNSYSENDNIWGENFQLLQPTHISAFEVLVDRHGLPTSDLCVYLDNSGPYEIKAEDIRTGDTLPPDERLLTPIKPEGVTSGVPAWYRITLDQPVTLAAGNHWIYLRTKGDTRYDYYRVPLDNADGLPVNKSWDNANSWAFRASMPYNSENLDGVVTQSFDYVDMPFRLILENYKENAMYTSPVLYTGKRVKWLNLTWENDTPENTQVIVQVRVGDMAHPEDPNLLDDPNYPWSEWKTIQKGQDLSEVFGADLAQDIDNRVANALQYRIKLSTTDPTVTPVVRAVYVRYFDGVGTTRAPLPIEWIQTTDGDFERGLGENGTENVYVGGGSVMLGSPIGVRWTTLTGPPLGVGGVNGHRIGTINGKVYCWIAVGDTLGTGIVTYYGSGILNKRFYVYDPSNPGAGWTWLTDVPFSGTSYSVYSIGVSEAKDSSGNPAIYAVTSTSYSSSMQFARWTDTGDSGTWTSLNYTVPWKKAYSRDKDQTDYTYSKTRNGAELVWDGGDNIYMFPGSGYGYDAYDWYVYSISGNSWTAMSQDIPGGTPGQPGVDPKNGPGNAACFVKIGDNKYIYVQFGHTPSGVYESAQFWRFNVNTQTWEQRTKHQYGADDGSDLVWDGGDYIYHMPGAYEEGLPHIEEDHFLRYSISSDVWQELDLIPVTSIGGVDDGGSMVKIGEDIYVLKGGSDVPASGGSTADNHFYRYTTHVSPPQGTFISTFDAGEVVNWQRIKFENITLDNTTFSLDVRFSDDNSSWSGWQGVASGQSLVSHSTRYVQYRATLTTTSENKTPSLNEVRISYTPISTESLSQTDWSGGSTSSLEAGTWSSSYNQYYRGENVDATVSVGDIVLVSGGENRLWGDNFLVDNVLGSDNLNDNLDRLSLRFRARRAENVYGVRVYVEGYDRAELAVKIHRDNAGNPGENITTEKQVEISSTGWLYIGFSTPAALVKDNVYHIVVRMVPLTRWVQTDWSGGPTKPSLQVGTWGDTYDNFYDNENVDWSQAGKVKLKSFLGIYEVSENIGPLADTFVRGGTGATYNNGTWTSMYVGRYSDSAERGYVKFDLSSIPWSEITGAKLWLDVYRAENGGANVQVERVDDDSWTESGITWNNQPDRTGLLVGPQLVNENFKWFSWTSSDFLSFVAGEYTGDGVVSLALIDTEEDGPTNNSYARFNTKEYSSTYAPMLEVTYKVLAYENSGWFESSVYDVGSSMNWGVVTWDASTPSQASVDNYTYASSYENVKGTVDNFAGEQQADGGYATLAERKVISGPAPGIANHVVISEFATRGPNGAYDEFLELYNPTSSAVDISNWTIGYYAGSSWSDTYVTYPAGASVPSYGFYLWGNSRTSGYSGPPTADYGSSGNGWADGTSGAARGVRIKNSGGTVIDTVVYEVNGGTYHAEAEGLRTSPNAATSPQSVERKSGPTHDDTKGNGYDDDNNQTDFYRRTTRQPQNKDNATETPPSSGADTYDMEIHENIDNIPSADTYTLQMRYELANTNDNFRVQVWDGSTWNTRGAVLSSTSWTDWSYTLLDNEVIGGKVQVRFVDDNSNSTAQDNILKDYLRVWSYAAPWSTSIVVKVRTGGDDNPYDGGWSDWYQHINSVENISMPNNRYVQYRVELSTTNENQTPVLESIRLAYTGAVGWATLRVSQPLNENMAYDSLTPDNAANVLWLVQEGLGVQDGHVGLWHFNEGAGTTTADNSGNGNTGTLTNGPTWVDGKYGKALSFDGVDDYVEVPNIYWDSSITGITISAWVNLDRLYPPGGEWYDQASTIVLMGDPDGYTEWLPTWQLWASHVYAHTFTFGSGEDSKVAATFTPTLGEWYYVVGTYDPSTGKISLYVNGHLESTASYTYTGNETTNDSPIWIGRGGYDDGNPSRFLDGTIDEVAIWNRALTASEIAEHAAGWDRKNNQPIYVLDVDTDADGSADAYDGDPYAVAGGMAIWGGNYAGETFTISSSFAGSSHHVRGVWVYVRKVGAPGDSLYYELWDLSNGTQLESGTLVTASQVGSSWTPINKLFSKEHLFVVGRTYRLYLRSSGSSSENYYEWMAPSAGATGDAYEQSTYGGTSSYASYRSGSSWSDYKGRDAIFRFIAARGYPSGGWLESSVFDVGREVGWQTIGWSAVTSSQTTVGVEVRTGVDNNPYDGGWNIWENVTNGERVTENRYVQYRVVENTTNENETPVFQSVTIRYPSRTSEAPEGSMIRTWVQTTTADFLADRVPDAIGQNVEVVSPGDLTLMAESYWGNEFVSTSGFPMGSRLDSENKLFAVRFVAEEDEIVDNAKFLVLVCLDGELRMPTYSIGQMENIYWDVLLVSDNNGVPDMSTSGILGRAKYAPYKQFPDTPRSEGPTDSRVISLEWYLPYPRLEKPYPGESGNFSPRPQLTGGQTYHLVITVSKDNANLINRDNWIAVVSHKRDNIQLDYWINGDTYNTNRAVLFGENRGGGIYRWENSTTAGSPVDGCDPMYLLGVERGGAGAVTDYEGDPYYKSDEEVYTNNYVGQSVPINKEYGDFSGDGIKVGAVEFFMKGVGEKIGEAHVGVRVGAENLTETTYSIPLDYSSRYSWTRFTLPASYTLWENELYKIYIRSPSSTPYSYGAVNIMKTPWETNTKDPYVAATYGGSSSQYIWSYNGENWDYKDYRDIPFRFVTKYRQSGNFVSDVLDAGQVVDWQYIEWDETRPPGTDIKLYVLAGGQRYGPFSNRSSLENVPDSRDISYEVELTTNNPSISPALHEVRIAYRGGFGSLRIELQNQGERRTLAYEGGAVIVEQENRSTMYSMPNDMIVFTPIDDNRMELDVNYRLLRNTLSVKSTALTAMAGANFYMPEEARIVRENENMRSVEINIVSDFAQAWYEYLQSVSDRINRSYPGWSKVTRPSEYETKLVINENEVENRSIAYRETVREIEVQIL